MPRVERAAYQRELVSSLRRATWAAEKLADHAPEVEEPESRPSPSNEEEGPITEPHRPTGRSLAFLSDGNVALPLTYLAGADLAGAIGGRVSSSRPRRSRRCSTA
jgi:hypothetical protein